MLTTEFNARYQAATVKYMEQAYVDGIKHIFTMEDCSCHNVDELWMFALESYDARPGATNILSDRQVHCLLCRMGGDENELDLDLIPAPSPLPGDPPPPSTLFTYNWAWMNDDPYAALLIADNIVYQGTAQAAPGSPLIVDFRPMPANQFNVVRYPTTESNKTEWIHNQFNYGVLPDQNYREVFIAHGYKYIVSRVGLTFTPDDLTQFF